MIDIGSYLRDHHPLLALRIQIEAYQHSLPIEEVFQIGNRFLPTRGGFGGCGCAYGKHLVLTEVHLQNPGNILPYAILQREEGTKYVLLFKTWWRDVLWLQVPSIDTGCGNQSKPMFRDFIEAVFDAQRYFPTHHSEV